MAYMQCLKTVEESNISKRLNLRAGGNTIFVLIELSTKPIALACLSSSNSKIHLLTLRSQVIRVSFLLVWGCQESLEGLLWHDFVKVR